MEKLILSGADHARFGQWEGSQLAGIFACISAGKDADSPSAANKVFANEDALFCCRQGDLLLLAVADGHFGGAAHRLIQSISARCIEMPTTLESLYPLLLDPIEAKFGEESATTALVARVDTRSGEVWGLSVGDSSVIRLSQQGCKVHNPLNDYYLECGQPGPREFAKPFSFTLQAGEGLMVYTDGVNECCYGDPQRSVHLEHIWNAFWDSGPNVSQWGTRVAQLALEGVSGHPGGQDNLALLCWIRDGELKKPGPRFKPKFDSGIRTSRYHQGWLSQQLALASRGQVALLVTFFALVSFLTGFSLGAFALLSTQKL